MKRLILALFIALCVTGLASTWIVAYNIGYEKGSRNLQPVKEEVKKTLVDIAGEKFEVLIDETGCYYMTLNGYGISPLFDKEGKVKGCGK